MNQADNRHPFDLEERTAKFGEQVIRFCRKIPLDPITSPLVSQLVNSATSVGANFGEADDAVSKKDFRHRIGVSRKEARESKHWLRMMAAAHPASIEEGRVLWQEAKELHLILSKIFRNLG